MLRTQALFKIFLGGKMRYLSLFAILLLPMPASAQSVLDEIFCEQQAGMEYDVQQHECITQEEYKRRYGGGSISDQSGGTGGASDGEWHAVTPNYPVYPDNTAKPWDENPDFWYGYYVDNYNRDCGQNTFAGTQRCAEVYAEMVRWGLCYSSRYDQRSLNAWQGSQQELMGFLNDQNAKPPDASFWNC